MFEFVIVIIRLFKNHKVKLKFHKQIFIYIIFRVILPVIALFVEENYS